MNRIKIPGVCLLILYLNMLMACHQKEQFDITVDSLLDEMISREDGARYPAIMYKSFRISGYDTSFISIDTVNGRIEKVLFDESGPGVITNLQSTTPGIRGIWRFYLDGSLSPSREITVGGYKTDGKHENTFFLPIPYAENGKITFEEELNAESSSGYYRVDYRRYPEGTSVETLSNKAVKKIQKKITETEEQLLNSVVDCDSILIHKQQILMAGDPIVMKLPQGEHAVHQLELKVNTGDSSYNVPIMRNIILQATFDGKKTVRVPVFDLSDGQGTVICSWLMPYRETATFALVNEGNQPAEVEISVCVSPLQWDDHMQYFYASRKQVTGIPLSGTAENEQNTIEQNLTTIHGKGIYKGDILIIFNRSSQWEGEMEEKIRVDDETNPSHFGKRTDFKSFAGDSILFYKSNSDGIPFSETFKCDIEISGDEKGMIDLATTVFWYGDIKARAEDS